MSREEMRKLMEAVDTTATAKKASGAAMVAFKDIMKEVLPEVRGTFYNDKQTTSRRLRAYLSPGKYEGTSNTSKAFQLLMKNLKNEQTRDRYLRKISNRMKKHGYKVKKIEYQQPYNGYVHYGSRAGYPSITIWIEPEY